VNVFGRNHEGGGRDVGETLALTRNRSDFGFCQIFQAEIIEIFGTPAWVVPARKAARKTVGLKIELIDIFFRSAIWYWFASQ